MGLSAARQSPDRPLRVLILGGTTEATALAAALAKDARVDATLSLAGVTRAPARPAIGLRVGGFGGATGLAAHLRAERVGALVDATHPFAARISAHAADAAEAAGVPRLVVLRPQWQAQPGDRWTAVDGAEDAAETLGASRRRVLLTIGRGDLAPFAARPWHRYVVRSVDPPGDAAPPDADIITARGPFDLDSEMRLLRARQIEIVVTKNSGGDAVGAKLHAARELGLGVVMIRRPPPPRGPIVATADAALDWLDHAARGV